MSPESEKITKKQRIDQMLKAAGWLIVPYTEGIKVSVLTNHAVEEFKTDHGYADYALAANGKLLGFVEAKKLDMFRPKLIFFQVMIREEYSKIVLKYVLETFHKRSDFDNHLLHRLDKM